MKSEESLSPLGNIVILIDGLWADSCFLPACAVARGAMVDFAAVFAAAPDRWTLEQKTGVCQAERRHCRIGGNDNKLEMNNAN